MSKMSQRFGLRIARLNGAVLPLCLALSACGGGGGGATNVASIPSPPVAPPAGATLPPGTKAYSYPRSDSIEIRKSTIESPATRAGIYDLMGRLTLTPGNGSPTIYRAAVPGEFTITSFVNQPHYMLTAPTSLLPSGANSWSAYFNTSWDINPTVAYHYLNPYGDDCCQTLGQTWTGVDRTTGRQLFTDSLTNASSSGYWQLDSQHRVSATLNYDIGYSYVAMGEWSWRVVDLNGNPAGDFGDLLFVNGDRTPASGIPASGTATYQARSLALLSSDGTAGIHFTLTADFGQRTMATAINQDYLYDPGRGTSDDAVLGIHVSGTSPFGNDGLFNIPLSGTMNYAYNNLPITPATEPVVGSLNGAFFGPKAEQVGGTFVLGRPGGTLLAQDAFVGQRPHP